jgi:hypothetical protein
MACDEFDYHSRRQKMTDDLVKRLREKAFRAESIEMLETAADRIEKLEAALRKIADIEHEDLPKPVGAAEGTLWVILAGCVEVAEKALEGKDD